MRVETLCASSWMTSGASGEIRITNTHKAAIEQYREPAARSVKSDVNLSFLNDFPKYSLEVIFIVGIAGLLALVTATQGADGLPFLMLFATACIRILRMRPV